MADAVRFIRKNGKIIPIRAASGAASGAAKHASGVARAAVAATGAVAIKRAGIKPKNKDIKVNRALDITGLGLSVASGALAAATFAGGARGFLGGHAAAHAIDAVGVSANVGSIAGRGHTKERLEQAAKQEARNFAVGNAVYLGGVLAFKKNREAAVHYGVKALGYAKKILEFGRKAVRVAV